MAFCSDDDFERTERRYDLKVNAILSAPDSARQIANLLYHATSVEVERNRLQESLCQTEVAYKEFREEVSDAMITLRDHITRREGHTTPVQTIVNYEGTHTVDFADFIETKEDKLTKLFDAVLSSNLTLFDKERKQLARLLAEAAREADNTI